MGQQQVSICSQDRICYRLSTCIEFLSALCVRQFMHKQQSRHVSGNVYPQLFSCLLVSAVHFACPVAPEHLQSPNLTQCNM